jgi:hypothetical protein
MTRLSKPKCRVDNGPPGSCLVLPGIIFFRVLLQCFVSSAPIILPYTKGLLPLLVEIPLVRRAAKD